MTNKDLSMELDYQAIFKQLNKEEIDYLVVGGLAVNFHGIPRMTYDIDLMIHLDPENIRKLVSTFVNWGYRPRVPVNPEDLADEKKRNSWIQEKNMKAFTFYNEDQPIGEVDLVIESPIPYADLRARAINIKLEGQDIAVVSIRDLIELKLDAGRKQDISDVENLKTILER
jgi:predicted nucleotidyltransferase